MYGAKNSNQYDGDCILEIGDITYIGRLMPGYQRTAQDLPVESQPIWQIERVDTVETEIPAQNEEDEPSYIYRTRRMYPSGIEDYRFAISDAANYEYDYRH